MGRGCDTVSKRLPHCVSGAAALGVRGCSPRCSGLPYVSPALRARAHRREHISRHRPTKLTHTAVDERGNLPRSLGVGPRVKGSRIRAGGWRPGAGGRGLGAGGCVAGCRCSVHTFRAQGCRCTVARLHGCTVTELHCRRVARYMVAMLQCCSVAGLQRLQGCRATSSSLRKSCRVITHGAPSPCVPVR